MIVFIFFRFLDIYTTLLNVNRWGADVEGNLIVRKILERGLFVQWQILFMGLIVLIAEYIPKYRRIIYVSLSAFSLLASFNNLFCYWFIK